ncbi:MAG: YceI family protein [Myxococcota bacterium]
MHRTKHLGILVAAAVLAVPAWAMADEQDFRVRRDGGSRVTFVSDAMLETINGVSSQVEGTLRVDPNDLSNASGKLQVPVSSIRTGIELRDQHLQSEKWLDAAKHPNVVFEITGVQGAKKLEPGKTASLKIRGKLSVHGVTRNVVAEARARYYPLTDKMRETPGIDGDVIRGKARFKIELSDYGVDIPTAVRLKVSNEITVNINLRAIAE